MTGWKKSSRVMGYSKRPSKVKKAARAIHHKRLRRVARQLIAMGREEQISDRPLTGRDLS